MNPLLPKLVTVVHHSNSDPKTVVYDICDCRSRSSDMLSDLKDSRNTCSSQTYM